MVCVTSCGVASALIGGMVYIMLTADKTSTMKDYIDSLDDPQKRMMKHVSQMRAKIWGKGLIIGLGLGLVWLYFNPTNTTSRNCVFTAIVMLVNYFYYILSPKQTYMIEHLKNSSQIAMWNKVRRMMQVKYHIGMVLGGLGCYALGRGL